MSLWNRWKNMKNKKAIIAGLTMLVCVLLVLHITKILIQTKVSNNIKSSMLLQVHDELIFDCVEEEKEKLVDIVTTIMESTVRLSVPLKVSHDFGTDLYETK